MGFLSQVWKDLVRNPVKTVTHEVSNLGSSISHQLANLDDSITNRVPGGWGGLAALGLGGYMLAPELSSMFTLSPEAAAVSGGEAALTGEGGSMLGSAALSSELPTGYAAGSVDALAGYGGAGSDLAAINSGVMSDAGTGLSFGGGAGGGTSLGGASGLELSAPTGGYGLEGNAAQGINASGFGAQPVGSGGSGFGISATPSTTSVPGGQLGWSTSPSAAGIGAPTEGFFAGGVPGAPTDPNFLSSMMAGNYGNALQSMGNTAWDTIKNNKLGTAMLGSSLYDMYAKNKMAKKQEALYNQNRADILGMYAPGSPEALAMQQEMARKDAASGRNSQYGIRATDFAANTAAFRANALSRLAPNQTALSAAQAGNQYGSLNSMFNNLAMYSLLNKNTR